MPFRTIGASGTRYALLSFDAKGQERQDDPHGSISERLLELAKTGESTNIFCFGHGWMGDVPAAIRQYDAWIGAFDALASDRNRAAKIFPGFRPLYIGLHWPSLPWGDEELRDDSFAAGGSTPARDLASTYTKRLGDTPAVGVAVRAIIEEARHGAANDALSERAKEALYALHGKLGLDGEIDTDGLPFDPDAIFEEAEEASFGGAGGGILAILRTLSYWSMKKFARTIGQGSLHDLLKRLQRATAAFDTPIHLMGHSFGCVLISAALSGPGGASPLERPVNSVALVQGALSLWSYASSIPHNAAPGYFSRVVGESKIRGPLITTRSRHDLAVNLPYQLASRASGAVSFDTAQYPIYGAIGRFGLQGLPDNVCVDTAMRGREKPYGFAGAKVYNLEASKFICKMQGTSGAHNDIGGPEVAHAIWEAAFASAGA